MKKFFNDFKKFISRGNILDMAVGVIIGGAFNAIVTAFTNQIIMPLINALLAVIFGGKNGLESAVTILIAGNDPTDPLKNAIYINWGSFISAILNFLIIALTLFIMLKVAMKSSEMFKHGMESYNKAKATKEEKAELAERGVNIKDRKAVKEAVVLLRAEKKAEADAKKAEEEAAKAAIETDSQLLKDIRDLLKAQAETKPAVKASAKAKAKKAE